MEILKEGELRPAAGPDLPYCYEICLKTGNNGKDASGLFSDPLLLGQFYTAPYFFFDLSLCFVVEKDRLPQGYILGVEDTGAFNRWMESQWLPTLRRRYPRPFPAAKSNMEQNIAGRIHTPLVLPEGVSPWPAAYPAHLHIDLLPPLQGKGWGRALIEDLLGELRNRGCPGIHLEVSAANTAAIAFYTKMGFSVLREAPWGLVMGKRITDAPA